MSDQLVQDFVNSIPVITNDGVENPILQQDSTRFESDKFSYTYADGRKIKKNDYIVHIRYHEGMAVYAGLAQIWNCLFYSDGQPIGVSLNAPNSESSPSIFMFTHSDSSGIEKRYFKTNVTYRQNQIATHILPLHHQGETLTNIDETYFLQRLNELSEHSGIATFALAMIEKDKNADNKEVIQLLLKASKQGYAHAFVHLSNYFQEGNGTPPNIEKSMEMLQLGSNGNDPFAQYKLAMEYVIGKNIDKNEPLAVKLLEKATQQSYPKAFFALGKYYRYGSFIWMSDKFYLNKEYPIPSDDFAHKAMEAFYILSFEDWSQKLEAKFYLADGLEDGIAVETDIDTALQLYQEIIEQDDIYSLEGQEAHFRFARFRIMQSKALKESGDEENANECLEEGIEIMEYAADSGHAMSQLFLSHGRIMGDLIPRDVEAGYEQLKLINRKSLSLPNRELIEQLIHQESRLKSIKGSKIHRDPETGEILPPKNSNNKIEHNKPKLYNPDQNKIDEEYEPRTINWLSIIIIVAILYMGFVLLAII